MVSDVKGARDTVSVGASIPRKISPMFTHNALTDAKMAIWKRSKLEKKATTQIYLLILTSCSHGIVPLRCYYSWRWMTIIHPEANLAQTLPRSKQPIPSAPKPYQLFYDR